MSKPIRQVWTFRSDSDPSREYQTLQYTNGTTSCQCPGWTRRVAADGSRSCKHTRWVDLGTAERHCTATHHYETQTLKPHTNHAPTKSNPHPASDSASSPSEMGARIIHYLQAGYPGIYLVSPEEQRVEAELKSVLQHLNRDRKAAEHYQLCYWSVVDGLVNTKTNQIHNANDPLDVLQAVSEQPERTILLLKDYHLFLQDPNPILVRKFKDVLLEAKTKQKAMILVGCRLVLPPELDREITVVEFALPGKQALRNVLDGILESAGIKDLAVESRRRRSLPPAV